MKSIRERVRLIAALDTLEYLRKGGRIGAVSSFLGSLLNVKPLVQVKDGEVLPLERVRTRNKALQRVAEIVKDLGKLERVAVVHAADLDGASELAGLLAPFFPIKEMYISDIGPVIGTHSGPKAVGAAVIIAKQ
jgi:DegV family protein with EDD domain